MKDCNQKEYKWAVVEFLEAPYPNIDQYICIPHPWIRIRHLTNCMSIVSYPDESPLIIKKKILKCENSSKKWKLCEAIVKYETNSYKAAKNYILLKKHDATTGNRKTTSLSTDHKISSVPTVVKTSPVKRIHPELKLKINRKKLKIDDTSSSNTDINLAITNSKECGIPTDYTINSFSNINSIRNNNEYCNSLLNNYLRSLQNFQILPGNIKETSIINPVTTFQGTKNKILYGTRAPLHLANQIRRSMQQQSSSIYMNSSNLAHLQAVCPDTTPQNLPSTYSDKETTYNLDENSNIEQVIVDEQTETICEQTFLPEQTIQETSTIQSSANNKSDSDRLIGNSIEELPILTEKVIIEAPVTDVADKQSPSEVTGETVAHQKFSEQTNQTKSSAEIADDWTDRIANIFKQMSIDLNHTCGVVLNMHDTLVHSAKVVEDIASAAENARKLSKSNGDKLKVTAKIQNATTVKPAEVKEKQAGIQEKQSVIVEKEKPDEEMKKNKSNSESMKSYNDNDDDDGDDDIEEIDDYDKDPDYKESVKNDKNEDQDDTEDKDKETPKKIRGYSRSFVLPPEYDPSDTRWTLKYKKNDSKLDLVELVPKSKVYINSIRLAHCKRASKDSKTLGRLLLVEIFNQSALRVCSLTGARANAFDINGDNVRPGLDEHARMTILSFVEDYTRQNNWGPFDSQSVINSIRSKIQEIRAKHSQTM